MPRSTAAILLLLLTAACDSLLGSSPDRLRRASILSTDLQPLAVTVPDSVNAGQSFEVRVRSYGDGCYEQGETPTVVQGTIAQVAPFDWLRRNANCTAVLQTFDHVTSVTFPTAGSATVVILGVHEPNRSQVTVTRPVVVRP
jgi:hypothetical protein